MNVRVGRHIPPAGGLAIRYALTDLLERANSGEITPFHLHCLFETQHPFLDGNGRSGRALWLWAMGGIEGIDRTFLPEFFKQAHGLYPQTDDFYVLRNAYYRILDASRDGP